MKYAPILIPTLCRSEHFIRLVESLKVNPWAVHTELYVALDMPPSAKYQEGWKQIQMYLDNSDLTAFKDVHVIKRERNYGAFGNIDALQNDIAERYDRFISIPDDMEVTPNFIEYMDRCLEEYEQDEDIVAVCGYNWPVEWKVSDGATCFKQNVTCTVWGTGYWSWKYIIARKAVESGEMLNRLPDVIRKKKYKNMIDVCKMEYINAACFRLYGHKWLLNLSDIGWRAYLAVYGKYAIAPVVSKSKNYGFDGSGAYCEKGVGDDMFAKQEVDSVDSFELVADRLCDYEENRTRLNKYDYRSDVVMAKTNRLVWLCENIGVWAAKLYCLLDMPRDIAIRVRNKYVKRKYSR